jgi:hypothetical protein
VYAGLHEEYGVSLTEYLVTISTQSRPGKGNPEMSIFHPVGPARAIPK